MPLPTRDLNPYAFAGGTAPARELRERALDVLLSDALAPGHRGEHGSLNAVQSRAPLLLSGAAVTVRGLVDAVARTVDVGATLAHLAGAS